MANLEVSTTVDGFFEDLSAHPQVALIVRARRRMFLAAYMLIGRSWASLGHPMNFKILSRILALMQGACCKLFNLATNP